MAYKSKIMRYDSLLTEKTMILKSRVKIHHELRGPEDAQETIIFLNGVMASVSSWNYYADYFTGHGYRILLHDFRGQLLSDKPTHPCTFEDHVMDLKEIMVESGIKKAHLIGTSYGGEVAMLFACTFPSMMESLSVIDSVSERDALLDSFIESWKTAASVMNPSDYLKIMIPTIYGNTFISENRSFLDKKITNMNSLPEDFLTGQINLYNTFLSLNITAQLKEISVPALIICGEEDILKPARFSRIIAANIPEATLRIIPDCGHVAIFEKPEEVKQLCADFIKKKHKEN